MRGPTGRLVATILLALLACVALAEPLRAQSQVLIVTGLGGEPRFTERFRALGGELATALHDRFAIPDANIAWLGEDSTTRDGRDPRYRGRSTRDALEKEVAAIRARAVPGGQVVVVFIGHGAGSELESRISLPGPDVTVADVQRWLAGFAQQRVAFVNLTSASGDFLPVLAAPGRVVITATKTSFERNESHFAGFFVKALAQDVGDVDKDGRVSLLEAFRFAARETRRVYDDATKLQTEHSQLDDDGSKQNTADPAGRAGQGMLARRFFLDARAGGAIAGGDAALAALYSQKFELEVQVDSVRAKKATLTREAYEVDLERVLIELARKSRDIRRAEGRP